MADGALAMILEKEFSKEKRGFIDSLYHTDSTLHDTIKFPTCGMSNIFNDSIPKEEKKMSWNVGDCSFFSDKWKKLTEAVLEDNKYTIEEIDHFLFSQFSKGDTLKTLDKLGVSREKQTFIAEKYGYTGSISPMFALYDALKEGNIQQGSNVVFSSVGSGFNMVVILYKF